MLKYSAKNSPKENVKFHHSGQNVSHLSLAGLSSHQCQVVPVETDTMKCFEVSSWILSSKVTWHLPDFPVNQESRRFQGARCRLSLPSAPKNPPECWLLEILHIYILQLLCATLCLCHRVMWEKQKKTHCHELTNPGSPLCPCSPCRWHQVFNVNFL